MTTKQQSLDDQLRQFDNEDDNISLADLMQKAAKAQDAKLGAKTEKTGDETNLDEVTAVKKKRVTYSLTSAVILSKDGLDDLKSRVEKFSAKSSSKAGYEMADLSRLLQIYRAWSENLGVRESANWPDFVEKLDRLKKNDIRKYIVGLREGREEEATQAKNPNLVPVKVNDSQEMVSDKGIIMAPPAVPPASTLTEEQRRLIEQKRLESIRRREERMKLLRADPIPETLVTDTLSRKDEDASFSQMQTQVLSEGLDTGSNFSQAPTQVLDHQETNAVMTKEDTEEDLEATTSVHNSDNLSQVLPSSEQCESPKKLRVIDE